MTGCGSPRHGSSQVKSVCEARHHVEVLQCLLTQQRQDLREDGGKVTEEVYWLQ